MLKATEFNEDKYEDNHMERFNNWIEGAISAKSAAKLIIFINVCVTLFHLLIVAQIIPYNIVWGGRLTSYSEMIRFESFSIAINLLIMAVAAMASGLVKSRLPKGIINILLWILFVMLVMNTIANPFSATALEAIVFTPLTFIMALCLYRLIVSRRDQPTID